MKRVMWKGSGGEGPASDDWAMRMGKRPLKMAQNFILVLFYRLVGSNKSRLKEISHE